MCWWNEDSSVDQKAFQKAIDKRWKPVGGSVYKCKVHGTVFQPEEGEFDSPVLEPCWDCFNEFSLDNKE